MKSWGLWLPMALLTGASIPCAQDTELLTVLGVSGKVTCVTPVNAKEQPLQKGQTIAVNSTITCGERSMTMIQLLDFGSMITVGADTKVQITNAVILTAGKRISLKLLVGKIAATITKLGVNDSMTVETPSVIASVRGTEFYVHSTEDGAMTLYVASGVMTLGKETVKEGMIAEAANDGSVAAPHVASADEIKKVMFGLEVHTRGLKKHPR